MPVALSGIIASVVGAGALGAALQTGLALITLAAGTTLGSLAIGLGITWHRRCFVQSNQSRKMRSRFASLRRPAFATMAA